MDLLNLVCTLCLTAHLLRDSIIVQVDHQDASIEAGRKEAGLCPQESVGLSDMQVCTSRGLRLPAAVADIDFFPEVC